MSRYERPLEPRYLNIKQAAAYTGLSEKTLYKWAPLGKIPAHKIGDVWRFDRFELDAFMHGQSLMEIVQSPQCSGASA